MKLLKDEIIEAERGIVKIKYNPINTSMQARLMQIASKGITFTAQQQMSELVLKEVLTSLTIAGKDYSAEERFEFAEKADLIDKATNIAYLTIGTLIVDKITLGAATIKKSEPPQKPTSSGGGATNARGQKKATPRKKGA